jgi:asparaginyl-tRNA synthetase
LEALRAAASAAGGVVKAAKEAAKAPGADAAALPAALAALTAAKSAVAAAEERARSVGGWVKTGRAANKDAFAFLELNDGSTPVNLQARPSRAAALRPAFP